MTTPPPDVRVPFPAEWRLGVPPMEAIVAHAARARASSYGAWWVWVRGNPPVPCSLRITGGKVCGDWVCVGFSRVAWGTWDHAELLQAAFGTWAATDIYCAPCTTEGHPEPWP